MQCCKFSPCLPYPTQDDALNLELQDVPPAPPPDDALNLELQDVPPAPPPTPPLPPGPVPPVPPQPPPRPRRADPVNYSSLHEYGKQGRNAWSETK